MKFTITHSQPQLHLVYIYIYIYIFFFLKQKFNIIPNPIFLDYILGTAITIIKCYLSISTINFKIFIT